MSDCMGGCQKSFVCRIDAGGSCDVLFGVIMTYPIDLDWNSSYGSVLGIVLLKLYATTGSSTPDARLKSLILAAGVIPQPFPYNKLSRIDFKRNPRRFTGISAAKPSIK